MKITPFEIINEFKVVYSSSDSARSKPNRYRSVFELWLKYLLDIPRDEYHSNAHLVSLSRTYNRAFRLDLPRRTRRLNEYFNKWSHANSSEFDIEEFIAIEDEFKLLLEAVLEILITAEIPVQKSVQSSIQKATKPSFNMTKSEVFSFIEQSVGEGVLNRNNFKFSNINKGSGLFWLDIPPEKFEDHLDIGLIDRKHIIWIRIPAGKITNPSDIFYLRSNINKVKLDIGVYDSDIFLVDRRSKFDFKSFSKIFSRNE